LKAGENFETICILTRAYMDTIGGMDKEEVVAHFCLLGFLHNLSILKVKISSKEQTYLSIPVNGLLRRTRLNDLEPKVS